MNRDQMVEACARAAHECNRAYCIALGDLSQPAWEAAPGWQRSSAINGVEGVLAGNGPEESHESWLAEKKAAGWKFGLVKDPEKKEHPCFVPYRQLPPEQKAKDGVYVATARAMALALGLASRVQTDTETGTLRRSAAIAPGVYLVEKGGRITLDPSPVDRSNVEVDRKELIDFVLAVMPKVAPAERTPS